MMWAFFDYGTHNLCAKRARLSAAWRMGVGETLK